jgi:hypothetical protein
MKAIRYGVHFTSLAVAAAIFWLAKDFRLPIWISNINFLHYALMGALHATSIVISLRVRRTVLRALGFITLAATLSAWTPIMGLWGSVVWVPFADILRKRDLGADAILVTGSVIGASGYWLLMRLFWLKSLRRIDWLRTAALCTTGTLLAVLTLSMFDEYAGDGQSADIISPALTVAWWFAFSISLYWSEKSEQSCKSTRAVATVT